MQSSEPELGSILGSHHCHFHTLLLVSPQYVSPAPSLASQGNQERCLGSGLEDLFSGPRSDGLTTWTSCFQSCHCICSQGGLFKLQSLITSLLA